jgi:hypothetical protein
MITDIWDDLEPDCRAWLDGLNPQYRQQQEDLLASEGQTTYIDNWKRHRADQQLAEKLGIY